MPDFTTPPDTRPEIPADDWLALCSRAMAITLQPEMQQTVLTALAWSYQDGCRYANGQSGGEMLVPRMPKRGKVR